MSAPTVVFSSINLAASHHALRSPEWLQEFAQGAGCSSVEYMPVYDHLPGHTPQAVGGAVLRGTLRLNSLHASFREGKASADTNRLPGDPGGDNIKGKVIRSPLGRLMLPEVCESAGIMGSIQDKAGLRVPVTLYPQRGFRRDRKQIDAANGSMHLLQPTDHVARLAGVSGIEEFNDTFRGARKYHYVWDTFHGRRMYGRGKRGIVSDTSVSVPTVAPYTRAMHLSLNRSDIPGEPHIPTLSETKKALKGEYDGELRDNLDILKDSGRVGYMVIEATLAGIAEASGHKQLADIQKDYADIAEGFRRYWQQR